MGALIVESSSESVKITFAPVGDIGTLFLAGSLCAHAASYNSQLCGCSTSQRQQKVFPGEPNHEKCPRHYPAKVICTVQHFWLTMKQILLVYSY